ncbi:hypothetical protein [Streptomyces yatensis]|uniref:Uncharacterized protein n=1 Tax=Streptomyces yatensis TaxID=155177 RepID=A0ABP4UP73_9ACTN|nr:hypothetical protein [Streptomyces yatensis]
MAKPGFAIGGSGRTNEIHLAADGACRPLEFALTEGHTGDAPAFSDVMALVRVPAAMVSRHQVSRDLGGAARRVLLAVLASRAATLGA